MNNYAPVLIFVYDRFNHLKNAVESLIKCPEAQNTEIFIASDMTSEKEKEFQINEIRDYIGSIKEFKKVTPIFFDKNVGIEHSWHYSLDLVFKKHDSIIILEDDIEVSPLFLRFINQGLNYYKNNPNIFSICGFSPSIMSDFYDKNAQNKIYFNHSWAAWGVASWKNKFLEFNEFRNSDGLLNFVNKDLKDNELVKSLNILSPKYYIHLLYCFKNKKVPEFDFLAAYYCLKNNMYNVYSNHTLTKNYGHDGTGLRSLKDELINSKMDRARYPEVLPDFKPINELDILNSLPLKSENNFQALLKIVLIKIGLFDFFKSIHRKFYKKIV